MTVSFRANPEAITDAAAAATAAAAAAASAAGVSSALPTEHVLPDVNHRIDVDPSPPSPKDDTMRQVTVDAVDAITTAVAHPHQSGPPPSSRNQDQPVANDSPVLQSESTQAVTHVPENGQHNASESIQPHDIDQAQTAIAVEATNGTETLDPSASDPATAEPPATDHPEPVQIEVVVATHDGSDHPRDPQEERMHVDPVHHIPVPSSEPHPTPMPDPHQLDPHVDALTLATDPTHNPHTHIPDLLPAAPPLIAPATDLPQTPVKKKRKTYNTEEERRRARILKNRRTAEESRQRRMKRMKELEEYAASAVVRERQLVDEIRGIKEELQSVSDSLRQTIEDKHAAIAKKDTELALKDAEIQRLRGKMSAK